MFKFDKYVCVGDRSSVIVGGITYTAIVEQDCDARIEDYDCYSSEDIARWLNNDWFFCGIVIESRLDDDTLIESSAASLWAIEANLGDSNNYLDVVAAELLPEAREATAKRVAHIRKALAKLD